MRKNASSSCGACALVQRLARVSKQSIMPTEYLKKILTSRVYDVAIETPLEQASLLSERLDNRIYFKREDMQSVFSFKLRGAYNKMALLPAAQLGRGVICASAGNHAQGVALAATRLGCRALIVMPTTTPAVKVDAVRARGGEVVLVGESYTDAYLHAKTLEQEEELSFVHPFDDPDVIAGQGTVGMEILRQHSRPIHAVFVAVGGGGLIAGVAAYIKAVRPEIKVIGVQTNDSDAMTRSLAAGERITLSEVGLFSDGTAVKLVGEETFRLAQKYVDEMIVVDGDAVCAAIRDVFQDTRSIVEPAGALAVAGIKEYLARARAAGKPLKNQMLVAVTGGANMNFDRLGFISERAAIGESREALLAVTIPEQRGSFKRFAELIGARSITEFNYRISGENQAHVFVGIQIASQEEIGLLRQEFASHGFKSMDLTHDELAKLHIRYMVGGKSPIAGNELLYRFEFPERPGALMRFLNSLSPDWNISLFHYRSQGGDIGRILVGMQVPPEDKPAFHATLDSLGYPHSDESSNPAYRLFL